MVFSLGCHFQKVLPAENSNYPYELPVFKFSALKNLLWAVASALQQFVSLSPDPPILSN
jgi:hypothetical protein